MLYLFEFLPNLKLFLSFGTLRTTCIMMATAQRTQILQNVTQYNFYTFNLKVN